MIYLLTEIGLTPGGSSIVHIYTQTIHRATQLTRTTQLTTTQLTTTQLTINYQLQSHLVRQNVNFRRLSARMLRIRHLSVRKPRIRPTRSVNNVMRLPAYRTIWQNCGFALHMKVR
jgi:hypothetical protein